MNGILITEEMDLTPYLGRIAVIVDPAGPAGKGYPRISRGGEGDNVSVDTGKVTIADAVGVEHTVQANCWRGNAIDTDPEEVQEHMRKAVARKAVAKDTRKQVRAMVREQVAELEAEALAELQSKGKA